MTPVYGTSMAQSAQNRGLKQEKSPLVPFCTLDRVPCAAPDSRPFFAFDGLVAGRSGAGKGMLAEVPEPVLILVLSSLFLTVVSIETCTGLRLLVSGD